MGHEELQKAESSSWSPRASFYRKGVATVAHKKWKGYSDVRLSLALHDKVHLMRLAQVSLLYRGRGRALSRPSPVPLASTRTLASDARGAM